MKSIIRLVVSFCLLTLPLRAQVPLRPLAPPQRPSGQFLTDSIEIGRPFRFVLTYRHRASAEVLFPDTTRHFLPFRVKQLTIAPTETKGDGPNAISRDSAVYTLISFETDSVQLLQVPIRIVNAADCTVLWTRPDTVFLRSRLTTLISGTATSKNLPLASETQLVRLQQQFNYPLLGEVMAIVGMVVAVVYLLLGRWVGQRWQLYQLYQQHLRFLREYNRLSRLLNADTATDMANQAVMIWKNYLEQLEQKPYASLTSSEIAERLGNDRVADALREADRMIYGGTFSAQSPDALRVLREVAVQIYRWRRSALRLASPDTKIDAPASSTF